MRFSARIGQLKWQATGLAVEERGAHRILDGTRRSAVHQAAMEDAEEFNEMEAKCWSRLAKLQQTFSSRHRRVTPAAQTTVPAAGTGYFSCSANTLTVSAISQSTSFWCAGQEVGQVCDLGTAGACIWRLCRESTSRRDQGVIAALLALAPADVGRGSLHLGHSRKGVLHRTEKHIVCGNQGAAIVDPTALARAGAGKSWLPLKRLVRPAKQADRC